MIEEDFGSSCSDFRCGSSDGSACSGSAQNSRTFGSRLDLKERSDALKLKNNEPVFKYLKFAQVEFRHCL